MDRLRPLRTEQGVRRTHSLTARDVATLLAVADRCGTVDGECIASVDTIATTVGADRTTVLRALARLRASGWVNRQRRGQHQPDRITLGATALQRSQDA